MCIRDRLYDGSPFHPDGNMLFDFAEQERMTQLGTSAKYIDQLMKTGIEPRRNHRLDSCLLYTSRCV